MRKRYASLDIIRGIALFGILLINIPSYGQGFTDDLPLPSMMQGNIVDLLLAIFVEKKFYTMFSFLFGVGFFIFASNAVERGQRPLWLFSKRLFFLFLFGLIHIFIFTGSILVIYALIGLILLPFFHRSTKTVGIWLSVLIVAHFTIGLLLYFQVIHSELFDSNDLLIVAISFITGLFFGKMGWLEANKRTSKALKTIAFITAPLFILGAILITQAYGGEIAPVMQISSIFVIPMSYFYLAILFLIFNQDKMAMRFGGVGLVGKMAFTNYLTQNLLGVMLISLLQLQVVTFIESLWLSVIIYGIQLVWSILFFERWSIGPFEWIWRKCTYGFKYQPPEEKIVKY